MELDIQSIILAQGAKFNAGLFILMLAMIVLSAFFSMSETAFSSTSQVKLKVEVENRKKGAKKALQLSENFEKVLTTLLIGNNLVNTALSTVSVTFFTLLAIDANWISLINTVVVTIVLLIFGEIVPKMIAKQHPEAICVKVAWIVYIISIIYFSLVFLFSSLQRLINRNNDDKNVLDENELGVLLNTMEEEGEIENDEASMIRNVFDLNDRTVEDIMIPRIQMEAIDYDSTLDEVKDFMLNHSFSRIPVYKKDKDHVIGILYERDFFPAIVKNPKCSWKRLIRPVKFVAASMKVDALIEELQKTKTHMAVVSGEYGDTLGLVTMEDALEELVGEIYDEHDVPDENEKRFEHQDDGSYIVDADMYVEDVFERLNIGDVPDDVPSKLSGWLFEKCESLPTEGFSFDYLSVYTTMNEETQEYTDYAKLLTLSIYEVEDRRITLVKIVVKDATPEEIEAHEETIEE